MKIDKTKKITQVCSKTIDHRYNLTSPYLHGNRLLASNGHMLTSIKIETESDDIDGFVPLDAVKQSPHYIDASDPDTVTTSNGTNIPRIKGDFPAAVIVDIIKKAHDGTFEISMNAKYLLALANGMNADNNEIRLKFKTVNDPILVRPNNSKSQDESVLMPCNVAK